MLKYGKIGVRKKIGKTLEWAYDMIGHGKI